MRANLRLAEQATDAADRPDALGSGAVGSGAVGQEVPPERPARHFSLRIGDAGLGMIVAAGLWLVTFGVAGMPSLAPVGVGLAMAGVALVSAGLVAAWERRRSAIEAVRHERMNAVLQIAERMTRTFDRQEIFRTIVTEVNRGLRADATTIRILKGDILEVAAWANMTDEAAARLPVFRWNEGRFGRIWATGRPWVCDDVAAERGRDDT